MNCIIVDDEKLGIQLLEGLCNKYGVTVFNTFTSPVAALTAINQQKPDFVLLDIQMDEMSGLDLAEQINEHIKIIFCTAYEQFAVKSYEFNAVDYLLKPISYARFCVAITRMEKLLGGTKKEEVPVIENDYIFFKMVSSKSIMKIDINSIDYIMSDRNTVHIYTNTGRKIVYTTLQDVEKRLPATRFMRVHKSYIVPARRIIQFNQNSIIISCSGIEQTIAIGDKYKEAVIAYLNSIQ